MTTIQLRRGNSAEWAAKNPVLGAGEFGVDLTLKQFKIGDGTTSWSSLAFQSGGGGGDGVWGAITGTLSSQTDLQGALDGKQPLSSVLTNTTAAFTTAQETKLAGVEVGATANSSDATLLNRANHTGVQAISTVTGLQSGLDAKQATLTSGTNIKTINGNSVLGSGDLVISGGVIAPVACRIYRNTNQSIPTGTGWTDLVFSTAAYQANGTFWASGATITIPEDGYYQIFAEGTLDGSGLLAAATANMQVLVNGTTTIVEDERTVAINGKPSLLGIAQRFFTAGSTIKMQFKHSEVGPLNLLAQGDHSPDIIITKLTGAKGDTGLTGGDVDGGAASTSYGGTTGINGGGANG